MADACYLTYCSAFYFCFFFFNDTATTEIYTLSLHDALPISPPRYEHGNHFHREPGGARSRPAVDRKSTRLNSSHSQISYAVFCLKKKKNNKITTTYRHTDQSCCLCHNVTMRTKLTVYSQPRT